VGRNRAVGNEVGKGVGRTDINSSFGKIGLSVSAVRQLSFPMLGLSGACTAMHSNLTRCRSSNQQISLYWFSVLLVSVSSAVGKRPHFQKPSFFF
jgi:hypothetical protein